MTYVTYAYASQKGLKICKEPCPFLKQTAEGDQEKEELPSKLVLGAEE